MRDLGICHTYKVFKTNCIKSMYFGLISEYDIVSKRFLYVPVVVSQWAGFPVDERRCIRHTHTRPCDNWPVSLNGFSFFRISYCCQIRTNVCLR